MYDHWNAFHLDSEVRRAAEDYITAPDPSLLFDSLYGWINTERDCALAMICAVAQITDDGAILDALAAGPLEDLLCVHGEAMLDTIRVLAREHLIFRSLVRGVWQNSMPKVLYQKVRAIGAGRL